MAREIAFRFAKEHGKKPKSRWATPAHAYVDNKSSPVHLTSRRRACAAQPAARGTYCARAQGLTQGRVKPRKAADVSHGKSVMVAVALSAREVIMR